MTFLEMQNLTAYWLDDLQFGYFTPAQVQLFLNNGLRELQKVLLQADQNTYVKIKERELIVNQDNYILPCDFLKLKRLAIITNTGTTNEIQKPLYSITINQQDKYAQQGVPDVYYLIQNRVYVRPVPQQVQTLRIFYDYRVPLMASPSDTPDAPVEYHEWIPIYAAIDGMMKDGRDPSTLLAKTKAFEERLKEDANNRVTAEPRMVTAYDDDWNGGVFF